MHHRAHQVLLGLLTACAVLLAGCTSSGPAARAGDRTTPAAAATARPRTVAVDPGSPAHLQLSSGAGVDVPAGAVSTHGTLSGAPVNAPAAPPAGLLADGPTYDLHVTGTTITGKVTVHLPAPPGFDPKRTDRPNVALLAYFDTGKHAWVPVPATYDPATGMLTATTPHLSLWGRFVVDTGKLLGAAGDAIKRTFTSSGYADQPDCPGEKDARAAGVHVGSDSGDLVKWCLGKTGDGQVVLRVANNRSFAMETTRPASWTMRQLGDTGTIEDHVRDAVTSVLSPAPRGQAVDILRGGETVEYTLPAGAAGTLRTSPSSEGYLIDALVFALETLELTTKAIPWGPKVEESKSRKAVEAALDSGECLRWLDSANHAEVRNAGDVLDVLQNAASLAVGCLGSQWKIAYGLTGAIGSFVGGVILWLAEGVSLVFKGVRGAIDSVVYWRSYRITVTVPAPPTTGPIPAAFLKAWFRHGESLTLRADGTGEHRYRTYDSVDQAHLWDEEIDQLNLAMAADGRTLLATVSAIRFDDGLSQNPHPTGDQHTGVRVGDVTAYTLRPDGALNRHQVKPPADPGSADQAFCADGVQDMDCGA